MRKIIIIMAMLATAGCWAGELVSTSTRAATEVWVSRRFASTNDVGAAINNAIAGINIDDARRVVQADNNAWITVEGGTGWLYRVTYPYAPYDAYVEVVSGSPGIVPVGGYVDVATSVKPDWELNTLGGIYRYATPQYRYTSVIGSNRIDGVYYLATIYFPLGPGAMEAQFERPIADGLYGDYVYHHGTPGNGSSGVLRLLSGAPITNRYQIATLADTAILIGEHDGDAAAHADIRQAIAAIPRIPVNYVAGINYNDRGSNIVATIIVSNKLASLWEVLQND